MNAAAQTKKRQGNFCGLSARGIERGRGAESPRNRSVRFSPESPRAPRVRNGFAQRLIFHRQM